MTGTSPKPQHRMFHNPRFLCTTADNSNICLMVNSWEFYVKFLPSKRGSVLDLRLFLHSNISLPFKSLHSDAQPHPRLQFLINAVLSLCFFPASSSKAGENHLWLLKEYIILEKAMIFHYVSSLFVWGSIRKCSSGHWIQYNSVMDKETEHDSLH